MTALQVLKQPKCKLCAVQYYPPYVWADNTLYATEDGDAKFCKWHKRMYDENWFNRRDDMWFLYISEEIRNDRAKSDFGEFSEGEF